ncbi:hypothetical protein C8F04DRAFT_1194401 [Mycena alexandri]|uniref:Uncharacterized protein n=1 Tax=Mycena alexandri TaxID=1745969 RepID=A0AAD6S7J7_9AGAR|nr:hypothetical protein C8F04DRAFT_1194401 [Mycena alexandri]
MAYPWGLRCATEGPLYKRYIVRKNASSWEEVCSSRVGYWQERCQTVQGTGHVRQQGGNRRQFATGLLQSRYRKHQMNTDDLQRVRKKAAFHCVKPPRRQRLPTSDGVTACADHGNTVCRRQIGTRRYTSADVSTPLNAVFEFTPPHLADSTFTYRKNWPISNERQKSPLRCRRAGESEHVPEPNQFTPIWTVRKVSALGLEKIFSDFGRIESC